MTSDGGFSLSVSLRRCWLIIIYISMTLTMRKAIKCSFYCDRCTKTALEYRLARFTLLSNRIVLIVQLLEIFPPLKYYQGNQQSLLHLIFKPKVQSTFTNANWNEEKAMKIMSKVIEISSILIQPKVLWIFIKNSNIRKMSAIRNSISNSKKKKFK